MGGVPLPEGYHSVNPYIVVDDAARLIDFLVEVFGAAEQGRSLRPDGRIDHGDVRIGDSLVMLSEASEAYPARPCVHFVYVQDVDATYRAALAAGATSILAPTEQSWGDRTCGFVDPFDNRWWVATHLRDFPSIDHLPTTRRLLGSPAASSGTGRPRRWSSTPPAACSHSLAPRQTSPESRRSPGPARPRTPKG